jgi:hypothetical protein
MKTILFTSSLALALFVAVPAYAADEAKCQEMFAATDQDKDGRIGKQEAIDHKADLEQVGLQEPTGENVITQAQFVEACMKK